MVIISISRQTRFLKNNYYFFVSHLAICDLVYLVGRFLTVLNRDFVKLFGSFVVYCVLTEIRNVFLDAGLHIVLIISLLRYRATIYPHYVLPSVGGNWSSLLVWGTFLAWLQAMEYVCLLQGSEAEAVYIRVYFSYVIICFYTSSQRP